MDWISVEDRLPGVDGNYLTWDPEFDCEVAVFCGRWLLPDICPKPTHWMPLPEPPKRVNPKGCWTPERGDKCDCPACGGPND